MAVLPLVRYYIWEFALSSFKAFISSLINFPSNTIVKKKKKLFNLRLSIKEENTNYLSISKKDWLELELNF